MIDFLQLTALITFPGCLVFLYSKNHLIIDPLQINHICSIQTGKD